MLIFVSSVLGGSFAARAWITEPVSALQEKMNQLTKGDLKVKAAGTHRRGGGKAERLSRRYPSLYLGGGNLAESGEHCGEPAKPSNPGEFRSGGRTATASHSRTGQATEPPTAHTPQRANLGMMSYCRAGAPPQPPRDSIRRKIGMGLTMIQTK